MRINYLTSNSLFLYIHKLRVKKVVNLHTQFIMLKTTKFANNQQFDEKNGTHTRQWFVIDANNKTLGRMCTEISKVLTGKNKPYYTPHVDTGDYVVVVNAEKV